MFGVDFFSSVGHLISNELANVLYNHGVLLQISSRIQTEALNGGLLQIAIASPFSSQLLELGRLGEHKLLDIRHGHVLIRIVAITGVVVLVAVLKIVFVIVVVIIGRVSATVTGRITRRIITATGRTSSARIRRTTARAVTPLIRSAGRGDGVRLSEMSAQFRLTASAARRIYSQRHVEQLQTAVFERVIGECFHARQRLDQPNDMRLAQTEQILSVKVDGKQLDEIIFFAQLFDALEYLLPEVAWRFVGEGLFVEALLDYSHREFGLALHLVYAAYVATPFEAFVNGPVEAGRFIANLLYE